MKVLLVLLSYISILLARGGGHARSHETGFADGGGSTGASLLFIILGGIIYVVYVYVTADKKVRKSANKAFVDGIRDIRKEMADDGKDTDDTFTSESLSSSIFPEADSNISNTIHRRKPIRRRRIPRSKMNINRNNPEDVPVEKTISIEEELELLLEEEDVPIAKTISKEKELETINQLFQDANAFDAKEVVLDIDVPIEVNSIEANREQFLVDSDLALLEKLHAEFPEVKVDRLYWEIIMSNSTNYISKKEEIYRLFFIHI